MHHTAVYSSNHHIHPTDFEPDWMSLNHPIKAVRMQCECLCSVLGAIYLVVEDHWAIDSPQPVDKAVARASVAWLHRGHCRVRREGLVILVAWSRAGRALISTNRFLILASQALHPCTHANTHSHMGTHTYVPTARGPSPHLL